MYSKVFWLVPLVFAGAGLKHHSGLTADHPQLHSGLLNFHPLTGVVHMESMEAALLKILSRVSKHRYRCLESIESGLRLRKILGHALDFVDSVASRLENLSFQNLVGPLLNVP